MVPKKVDTSEPQEHYEAGPVAKTDLVPIVAGDPGRNG
jgi:hypothetical protein